ncbi:MAG: hypothetical protein R6X35_08220 [Candidatus Krumholzibacteriia bacterium]
MRAVVLVLVLLPLAAATAAAQGDAECGVRYLSADHVYLDCGRLAGLEAGATVRIVRGGTQVAELQVDYAADHSASCRVVQAVGEIQVGDRAFYVPAQPVAPPVSAAPDTVRRRERALRAPATATARAQAPGPRLSGGAALRWERMEETGGTDVGSTVLTLPFRLRARSLGRGWEFRARGSLRRLDRRGGDGVRADREWRNRIHQTALVRDGRREAWHLAVGRIGVRAAAAAGPLDGLAASRRLGAGWRVGAFGGWAPAWQDLDFSTADQVAGVTVELDPTGAGAAGLGLVLAGVGRYHEGEISREHVALTTTWRGGPGLTLLQAAEVDLNRGWKRDAGADALRLSSFALTGRWQAGRRLAFRAGFDDREPVRTWETRDRPDSLFQDAGRRGLRGGVELRGGRGRRLDLDGSVRSPAGDGADTKSWSARLWLPAWPSAALDLEASVRGFTGPYLGGLAPTLGVSHRGRSGWSLRGAGGLYRYTDQVGDDDRSSTWLSAAVERDLGRRWSALAEARGDWGDAGDLRSLALEARCRF